MSAKPIRSIRTPILFILLLIASRDILAQSEDRVVTSSQYFATIPFPESCRAVPLEPSEEESRVVSTLKSEIPDPASACRAFAGWTSRRRLSTTSKSFSEDTPSFASALAPDHYFKRESKNTQEWLVTNFGPSQVVLVRAFLAEPTITILRKIGPQTNWALLQELLPTGRTLSDLKERADIERFWKVTNTPGFARLSDHLKDYVAAHLLSNNYFFMAPLVEGVRADLETNTLDKRHSHRVNPLLSELIRDSSSAVESILRVDTPVAHLFHQLNDTIKFDLVRLLFESWDEKERSSYFSFYSQQPVWVGEIGLFSFISQRDGSALEFLSQLNVSELTQSDRLVLLYSLLEGGSSLDAQEVRKRIAYLKTLLGSSVYSRATAQVRNQLLAASRVPAIGLTDSEERFDFRENLTKIFDAAARLQIASDFINSLAECYQRVQANWYISPGNPALHFIPYSLHPTFGAQAYWTMKLHVLYPDQSSALSLRTIAIEAPASRFAANAGIPLDTSLLFKLRHRAWLGGPSSRRSIIVEGTRFQTEDLHIRYVDGVEVIIRIPTRQRATATAQPPNLPFIIMAVGLMPKSIRSEPSSIVLLPFELSERKDEKILAFYHIRTNSIYFLQVSSKESWTGNFKPATNLLHEYAHLVFYRLLLMDKESSPLRAEYRLAVKADQSEVSKYGSRSLSEDSLSEDFAEAFMLANIISYAPSHDLEHAYKTLFPNRLAFFKKHVSKFWDGT